MKLRTQRVFIALLAFLMVGIASVNAYTFNVTQWNPFGVLNLEKLILRGLDYTGIILDATDMTIKIDPFHDNTNEGSIRVYQICDEYGNNCKKIENLGTGNGQINVGEGIITFKDASGNTIDTINVNTFDDKTIQLPGGGGGGGTPGIGIQSITTERTTNATRIIVHLTNNTAPSFEIPDGTAGAGITNAYFDGDDIVFLKENNDIIRIPGGKTEITGPRGNTGATGTGADISTGTITFKRLSGDVETTVGTITIYSNQSNQDVFLPAGGGGGTEVSPATANTYGTVKLGSDNIQSVPANVTQAISGKTYRIQKNSEGQLVVNVPWEDHDTQVVVDGSNNYICVKSGDDLKCNISTGSLVYTTGNQNIDGIKKFINPRFALEKTNDAQNSGTLMASEAQVYKLKNKMSSNTLSLSVNGVLQKTYNVYSGSETFTINVPTLTGQDERICIKSGNSIYCNGIKLGDMTNGKLCYYNSTKNAIECTQSQVTGDNTGLQGGGTTGGICIWSSDNYLSCTTTLSGLVTIQDDSTSSTQYCYSTDGQTLHCNGTLLEEINNKYVNKEDVAQTISGTKTFVISPVVPSKTSKAGNNDTAIATETQVWSGDLLLSGRFSDYPKKNTPEKIIGAREFSGNVEPTIKKRGIFKAIEDNHFFATEYQVWTGDMELSGRIAELSGMIAELTGSMGATGAKGDTGAMGATGAKGDTGAMGNGIDTVIPTRSGNETEVKIIYSDETQEPTIFKIYDGKDGEDGTGGTTDVEGLPEHRCRYHCEGGSISVTWSCGGQWNEIQECKKARNEFEGMGCTNPTNDSECIHILEGVEGNSWISLETDSSGATCQIMCDQLEPSCSGECSGGGDSYTLPTATTSILGGVKLGNDNVQTTTVNGTPSNAAGKTYPIQLDSNGRMVVNVPRVSGSGGSGISMSQYYSNNTNYYCYSIDSKTISCNAQLPSGLGGYRTGVTVTPEVGEEGETFTVIHPTGSGSVVSIGTIQTDPQFTFTVEGIQKFVGGSAFFAYKGEPYASLKIDGDGLKIKEAIDFYMAGNVNGTSNPRTNDKTNHYGLAVGGPVAIGYNNNDNYIYMYAQGSKNDNNRHYEIMGSNELAVGTISGGFLYFNKSTAGNPNYSNYSIGVNTTTPYATLDVNGSIKISDHCATCDSYHRGSIIYRDDHFYGCRNDNKRHRLDGTGNSLTNRSTSCERVNFLQTNVTLQPTTLAY